MESEDVTGRVILEATGCLELQALGVGDNNYGPVRVSGDDELCGGGLACTGACGYDNVLSSRKPYNCLLLC